MPKLHIQSGALEGKTFDLLEERVTLGRGSDNMVRLEDGTVSHHHAMLVLDGNDYTLRDLNSTNGTRVNGLRIVETKLQNGDNVRLGSVEMRFEGDVKKASQPMPPVRTGVDLSDLGTAAQKPESFGSVSPFGSRAAPQRSILLWVVIGLGAAAAVLLAFLVVKVLSIR